MPFLRTLGVDILKHKLLVCDAIKHVPQSRITLQHQADIENLRNLMFVRSEQSFFEGFDDHVIDCMIQYHSDILTVILYFISIFKPLYYYIFYYAIVYDSNKINK